MRSPLPQPELFGTGLPEHDHYDVRRATCDVRRAAASASEPAASLLSMAEGLFDRVWTVPNVITFLRLLGIPWFLWELFANDDPGKAGIIIAVVATTDWVDGTLARALHQESELGRRMDPVADRLAIVAAVIGGAIWGVLPMIFVVPLIIREVGMALLTFYLLFKGLGTLQVRYIGKVATALVYTAIPAFYLSFSYAPRLFEALGRTAGAVGLVLYWYVSLRYLSDAKKMIDGDVA